MSDTDLSMSYPCHLLRGEKSGLVCISIGVVTCLCLFTNSDSMLTFQQDWKNQQQIEFPFSSDVACVTYHNHDELIAGLKSAEIELAEPGIRNLAIDPQPGQPVLFVGIREFIEQLPRQ